MPKAKEPSIFVARTSGDIKIDGEVYSYRAGRTRVREGHPLLRVIPERFEPLKVDYEIEQATAAPGEKRGD